MRRKVLLLVCLTFVFALFFTVAPLQASAKSLTQTSAKHSSSVKTTDCSYGQWVSENYDSWLDVQLYADTCDGEWFAEARMIQNTYIQVFVDIGGVGGGGYNSNEQYVSQGEVLYAGEIYGGPQGAYTCAAIVSTGDSVCTNG